jgi:hypothetical protein
VPESDRESIVLSRARLRWILVVATALVSGAGLVVEVLKSIYHWKGYSGVVPFLSLSYENNLPSYYSAALLLFASLASAIMALHAQKADRRSMLPWWGLCAGFFYISLDEALSFHETWGDSFHLKGFLHYGWVIPGGCIVLLVGALYSRFLWRLPRRMALRLLFAGGLYVFGAVGMDLPLGYWAEKEGTKNLGYGLIDWAEETMEMAAMVLFLSLIMDSLSAGRVTLQLDRSQEKPAEKTDAPAGEGPSEQAPSEKLPAEAGQDAA